MPPAPEQTAEAIKKDYEAGQKALNRVKKAQPVLYEKLLDDWFAAKFLVNADVLRDLKAVKDAGDRKAITVFMQNKQAVAFMLAKAAAPSVKGVGEVIAGGAGITGRLPQNVGNAVGTGLSNAVNTSLFQLFRMGASAAVLLVAAVLIVLGIVILLRQPLTKAASAAAKAVT
jgi:hypothetical protein